MIYIYGSPIKKIIVFFSYFENRIFDGTCDNYYDLPYDYKTFTISLKNDKIKIWIINFWFIPIRMSKRNYVNGIKTSKIFLKGH